MTDVSWSLKTNMAALETNDARAGNFEENLERSVRATQSAADSNSSSSQQKKTHHVPSERERHERAQQD